MVFSHGNLVAHWKNKVEDTQNGCSGGYIFTQAAFRLSGLLQQQGTLVPLLLKKLLVVVVVFCFAIRVKGMFLPWYFV